MTTTTISPPKPQKTDYSAEEAALTLGISLDQLQSLIRQHLVVEDGEIPNVVQTQFQDSDLLLLRFLLKK